MVEEHDVILPSLRLAVWNRFQMASAGGEEDYHELFTKLRRIGACSKLVNRRMGLSGGDPTVGCRALMNVVERDRGTDSTTDLLEPLSLRANGASPPSIITTQNITPDQLMDYYTCVVPDKRGERDPVWIRRPESATQLPVRSDHCDAKIDVDFAWAIQEVGKLL